MCPYYFFQDRESEMTKAQSAHLEVENHLEVEKIVSGRLSVPWWKIL